MNKDYDDINRPFGEHLERDPENLVPESGEGSFGVSTGDGTGTASQGDSEAPNNEPFNSPEAFGDVWINNFIKSHDWKPKKQGFSLDGLTGKAEFSGVYVSGDITAETGYIGGEDGWVISDGYIKDVAGTTGLSSIVTGGNDIRFWAGSADPATAPFRVYENGDVVGTSMTLSGYIVVGGGEADVAGTLGQLSDLNNDLGSITAGTITGALIRTSSSGSRVQLNDSTNTMQIYDSGGTVRAESFQDGIQFYRSSGTLTGSVYDSATEGAFVFAGTGRNVGMITNSNQVDLKAGSVGFQLNDTTNSVRSDDLEPFLDGLSDLGANSLRWGTIYGDKVDAANSMELNGVTITAWTDIGGGGADTDLNNLTTTSVNQSLLPSGSTQDIGSSTLPWDWGYFDDIDVRGGNIYYNGALSIDLGSTAIWIAEHLLPGTSGVQNLGSATDVWNTLYVDDIWMNSNIDMNGGDINELDRLNGTTGTIDLSSDGVGMYDDVDMNGNNIKAIDELYFQNNTSNPNTDGQFHYYENGADEFQCQAGGFVGSVDLTAT